MSTTDDAAAIGDRAIEPLAKIVERDQVWHKMAAKYGVQHPMPPWKTSLDGICDALDHAAPGTEVLGCRERRDEEDRLSGTTYSGLPFPESQLVSLTHSLIARGVIDETELRERLAAIRTKLRS